MCRLRRGEVKVLQFESRDFVGDQSVYHVNLDMVAYLVEGKDAWYVQMNGQACQVTKPAFEKIKAALYERGS